LTGPVTPVIVWADLLSDGPTDRTGVEGDGNELREDG